MARLRLNINDFKRTRKINQNPSTKQKVAGSNPAGHEIFLMKTILKRNLHHGVVLAGLFLGLFILLKTKNPFGEIADHTFFIVHLISNKVYFIKNGLFHLPYYLPSFNGGFPQYADPQDMWFSLIQFSVHFFKDVYVALKVAFIVQLALCYFGMFRLRRLFDVPDWLGCWAGALFAMNGFNIVRWLIGNLTFHSYWVLPF